MGGKKRKQRSSLNAEGSENVEEISVKVIEEGEKASKKQKIEEKSKEVEDQEEEWENDNGSLDEEDDEESMGQSDHGGSEGVNETEDGKESRSTQIKEQEEKDTEIHPQSNSFFSEIAFSELPICDFLKKALESMNMKTLTEIQAKSVPILLEGRDVLGAARTGSGKTLSFLIPAMDMMYKVKFLPRNGTGVIVISPTRELALQIYDVATELCKYLPQTHGLIMGGVNRRQEAEKLAKGVNLLVATPGRLLDHLQSTKGFVYTNLAMLVIDEADRILEIGFEEDMTAILKILPSKRQTALFSATQTAKVADLARLSLKKPVLVEVKSTFATVEGLEQGYVMCPAADRFKLLFTFLKRNREKKVMVFFSSCMSVKFHNELFNYIDLPTVCIHGKKKQSARMSTYYDFCQSPKGIMLCTDVAARGLDIPKVDWIVQYDPPDDPREYIHRVGRTARGAGGKGKALLFLMPQEAGFLQFLKQAKVPLTEYKFAANKIASVQEQLEKLIEKNYHLHCSSRDAYRSYLHAYVSHALKEIFDVHQLDLKQVALSFGFAHPPKVDLNLRAMSAAKTRRKETKRTVHQKSGKPFSAANPTGRRDPKDRRQFTR